MSKKPAIPSVPRGSQPREKFDEAIAETIQVITGRRGDKITELASSATLPQAVAKINELIRLLQT